MTIRGLCRAPLSACFTAVAGICLSAAALAELPVEELTVVPAVTARNRAYISDVAINHIADGKLHVVDTDTGNYLGVIGSGFIGQVTYSPDRSEILLATGYLSRGQRGERTDILEVWDADTLSFKYEIEISSNRAMALNYRNLIRTSADGRWVFVQNATPATSVTVVDLQEKKMVSEIPTPGCWGIFPPAGSSDRFSTLCGDGTVATVLLDGSGNAASRTISPKIFDADKDAWFIQGEQDGDLYRFATFLGNVGVINVGGDTASLVETWGLVKTAADRKAGWRPGGYQPLAVHPGSNRLYVAMHPGGAEGSHKTPAKEIWAFDLKTKKRVARLPGHAAVALTASSSGKRVLAIDIEKLNLVAIEIGAKPKSRVLTQVGEIPVQVDSN
ncbi:MAG TPA: amine dehydrogenase large subunit [Burkholderiales bacterium]